MIATRFCNYAAIWWAELQKKRENKNIDLGETWIEMKNLLKQKFLPINYSRDPQEIYVQDLKHESRTIVEYSGEFMTMQARCGLNVADDVLVD